MPRWSDPPVQSDAVSTEKTPVTGVDAVRGEPPRRRMSLRGRVRRVNRTLAVLLGSMLVLNLAVLVYLLGMLHPQLVHDTVGVRALREVNFGMLNQETGIRGALLTHDSTFLAPYRTGVTQVEANRQALTDDLGRDGHLRNEVDDLLAKADEWQRTFAEPTV